jgi:hypothetical protein
MRGLDPRIHVFANTMDCRVSPLRGGPAMTGVDAPIQ